MDRNIKCHVCKVTRYGYCDGKCVMTHCQRKHTCQKKTENNPDGCCVTQHTDKK